MKILENAAFIIPLRTQSLKKKISKILKYTNTSNNKFSE